VKPLAIIFLLSLAACAGPRAVEPAPTWRVPNMRPIETNRILLRPREGFRGTLAELLPSRNIQASNAIAGPGIQILELRSSVDPDQAVRDLRARPEIEWAEREARIPPAVVTVNDPSYSSQWFLGKIEAPAAWETTTGSPAVIIAILDTGCDPTHPDLAAKYVPGFNFYDQNENTADVYGHGTATAGCAAAIGGNSVGVASVAWGCRIMPLRITGTDGYASTATIAQALTWAADHGARVANLSFAASDYFSVGSAADYFQQKGGVVTISAGNEGTVSGGQDNPYVLTVAASTNIDTIASWSNTGGNIDVASPGTMLFVTANGSAYNWFSGTSASAPVVAGIAALVMSANPSLSGVQVLEIIKRSSDDLGAAEWDAGFGWGRVNAGRAVAFAGGGSTPSPSATLASPSPTSPPGDTQAPTITITNPPNGSRIRNAQPVEIRVTVADNVGVLRVDAYLEGVAIGSSTTAPFSINWVPNTLTRKSKYNLQAQAIDAAGNTGVTAIVVSR